MVFQTLKNEMSPGVVGAQTFLSSPVVALQASLRMGARLPIWLELFPHRTRRSEAGHGEAGRVSPCQWKESHASITAHCSCEPPGTWRFSSLRDPQDTGCGAGRLSCRHLESHIMPLPRVQLQNVGVQSGSSLPHYGPHTSLL